MSNPVLRIAMLCFLLPLLLALPTLASPPETSPAAPDAMALGWELTQHFRAGETGPVWQRMTSEMREVFGGSEEALQQFSAQVRQQLGEAKELQEELVETQGDLRVYVRAESFEKAPGGVVTSWTFDEAGQVTGFFVRPRPVAAPSVSQEKDDLPYADYETQAALRLPFEGPWYVYWGGRTPEKNYHVAHADQRYAYDFLVYVEGKSYRGDGKELSDYYCWNRPVLAPAAGEVVAVVGDLPDQVPGQMDPSHPAGNYVILDLGKGEFALFAHLRQGSLTVEPGSRVTAGQELARCGNSGNTTEPHLHFHLQNGPEFGRGEGLPAFFLDYRADGEAVARGEPQKGQTVEPQAMLEEAVSSPPA